VLIDASVPGDRNVIKKEAKKILKHKNHIMEIHRMWNAKEKGIPEIIWGVWNQFRITQTISEQHTRKARN
jgi:glycerophosphoryl diester phosphodiesterase